MNGLKRTRTLWRTEGVMGFVRAAGKRAAIARRSPEPAPHNPFDDVLAWLGQRNEIAIVQVGAFGGDSYNDPLYGFLTAPQRPPVRAVLIEPVPEYFEQLKRAYEGIEGVTCENIAIAETAGSRPFYRLGVEPADYGMPDWLKQLGSLRPDRMTDVWDRYEAYPKLQEFWARHRVVEDVTCDTLTNVLTRNAMPHVDLLQIDAEGYDHAILKTVDFERSPPRVINYERVLCPLTRSPSAARSCTKPAMSSSTGGKTRFASALDSSLLAE